MQLVPDDPDLASNGTLVRRPFIVPLLEPIAHLPYQFGLRGRQAVLVNAANERRVE